MDLSKYSVEDIAEGYFDSEAYSEKLKEKIQRYRELLREKELSEEGRAERI